MFRSQLNPLLLVLLVLLSSSRISAAQSDCSEQLAILDQRIAAAKSADLKIQMARLIRSSLEKSCSFLDDAARQEIMDNIDLLLSTKSEEEMRAAREARMAAETSDREAEKPVEAQVQQENPVTSAVLQAVPTARTLATRFIDRPEDMVTLWIWDWDMFGGNMRVLYTTVPSVQQLERPDWSQNVYVVEMTAEGIATQSLVTSKKTLDHAALALRRDYDEIILERRAEQAGQPRTLERWSISGQKRVSSVATPSPPWADGSRWDWQPFRLATRDGNLLFSANKESRDGVSTIAWFAASPDGQVLGRGSVSSATETISSTLWFHTDNGGGGLISHYQATVETGIESAIPTPITRFLAGRELRAYVGSETRLLVTSNDGTSVWESPAIERSLMWTGDLVAPEGLSIDEAVRQQTEQMDIMMSVSNEFDANRFTNNLNVGPHRVEIVKPVGDGYGVLTTVSANRRLRPPIHGPYFLELDHSSIRKTTYLNWIAEQLKVKFTTFAVSSKNDLFLYGVPTGREKNAFVVMLDAHREPKAYGRIEPFRGDVQGMFADDTGVWLFGYGDPDRKLDRLWVGRIEFGSSQ